LDIEVGAHSNPFTNPRKRKTKPKRINTMNNKFDELAKGLAQSVTRRQALKRFGVGLEGLAGTRAGFVATFGAVDQKSDTSVFAAKVGR
jgi:hypothetical protein